MKKQIQFTILFCQRNRALMELTTLDQVERISNYAFDDYITSGMTFFDWFDKSYKTTILAYIKDNLLDSDTQIIQALLSSTQAKAAKL